MMALSDFTPVRQTVQFEGGEVDVRGLALDDVALLMKQHLPDIDTLVDVFVQQTRKTDEEAMDLDNIIHHAIGALRTAPGLVAHTIALASDEPDHVDIARSLPLPVQIQLVREIVELTFREAGGPKNFLASLSHLIRGLTPTMM